MSHSRKKAALRGRLFFLLAVVLAVGGAAWWWSKRPRAPTIHVLVITIDTLGRAAATLDDMPVLHELAGKGKRWSQARAVAPLTLPGHTTLFSGLEPPAHGTRDNTAAPLPPRGERGFSLLAEEFRDAGYTTAAFVAASVLDRRFALDAGFAEYRQPAQAANGPSFEFLDGTEQVKRFVQWTKQRPTDRPWFAWVHLWEPHANYRAYVGDEEHAGTTEEDSAEELYRGEVRKADAMLRALLAQVDLETTIVVVTSDHGESLGQHGEKTHGMLCYGATMDIPLVIAGPGFSKNEINAALCGLQDIAPTLRRVCRLPAQRTDGADLLRLPTERVLCGESLYAHRRYGWAQLSVATDGRYSLIDAGPRLELFDRQTDPGETAPLPNPTAHPAYARLDRALLAYRARKRGGRDGAPLAGAPIYYGAQVMAAGDFLKPVANRKLKDVRDHLDDAALISRAEGAIAWAKARPGQIPFDMDPLRELTTRDPQNPAARLTYGRALFYLEEDEAGAAREIEAAVALGFDSASLLRLLAEAYRRAGEPAKAAAAEKRAERKKRGR